MQADPETNVEADVCLVLEGTYPYVAGGVSAWVHELIGSLPDVTFALLHIGPEPSTYSKLHYQLPRNVVRLAEHYCHDKFGKTAGRSGLRARDARGSRTLAALRRLHLDEIVDDRMIEDLAVTDLSVAELLHGDEAFEVISEIARVRAPHAPFLDFFWHFRSMHVPLLRLLAVDTPRAGVYHSVSTGFAGVVAAVASHRAKRPMLLTEHGIYAREREMELARARWVSEDSDPRLPQLTQSPLRRMWSRFFMKLSQIAYDQSIHIVTISEVNRQKQLDDGAKPDKTVVIPNGVHIGHRIQAEVAQPLRPMRVGFVGRVVQIKDVLTFIKACDLALQEVKLVVEVIGPTEEDPGYVTRCHELVKTLGRTREIQFVGPKKQASIFGNLDVCVLTSFSEGQPLVILEAHAAGVPVIATDVGACREMLEGGRDPADRALGPGGIVTRVMDPGETAAALVQFAKSPGLRRRMGAAGHARVTRSYAKPKMIDAYRALYGNLGEVQ